MEVDDQMPGNAGDACMATTTGTRHPYQHSPVSYATYTQQALGSPQRIHTDTDATMEFNTLKVTARAVPPQGLAKELCTPDLVNHLTKVMASATAEVIDGLAQPPPVTNAVVPERFMQRNTMAAQHSSTNQVPSATSRVTVWDRLAHRQQTPHPPKEDPWLTWPEMMPRKTERGCQPERSQEPSRSTSQVVQDSGRSTSQKR